MEVTNAPRPGAQSPRERCAAAVIRSLRKANRTLEHWDIDEDSSVVDDLGFDSLKMIDLVFALEEELGITLPLQAWHDSELSRASGVRFAVGSLVSEVVACVSRAHQFGADE